MIQDGRNPQNHQLVLLDGQSGMNQLFFGIFQPQTSSNSSLPPATHYAAVHPCYCCVCCCAARGCCVRDHGLGHSHKPGQRFRQPAYRNARSHCAVVHQQQHLESADSSVCAWRLDGCAVQPYELHRPAQVCGSVLLQHPYNQQQQQPDCAEQTSNGADAAYMCTPAHSIKSRQGAQGLMTVDNWHQHHSKQLSSHTAAHVLGHGDMQSSNSRRQE